MDSGLILFWIISWGLIGLVVTPFVYESKGRSRSEGFVTGTIVGIVGGIILLLPLWIFVPSTGKVCPVCAETVKREAKVCKHCGAEIGNVIPKKESDQAYKKAMDAFLKRRYDTTIALATHALELEPRAIGYLLRAKSYKKLGKSTESIQDFHRYQALSEQNALQ